MSKTLLIALVALAIAKLTAAAPIEPTDPLAALRGRPAVIDLPSLDEFGQHLTVPDGWGYYQVTAETLQSLKKRLVVRTVPALVYVDRFGNVLVRDTGANCRRRSRAAIKEFGKRRRALSDQLQLLWKESVAARKDQRQDRELVRIHKILALDLLGYDEVEKAGARLADIELDREQRLLRLLAGEGIIASARLRSGLEKLLRVSRGLHMEKRLQREINRVDAGVVVRKHVDQEQD